jgi:hypothetical protein
MVNHLRKTYLKISASVVLLLILQFAYLAYGSRIVDLLSQKEAVTLDSENNFLNTEENVNIPEVSSQIENSLALKTLNLELTESKQVHQNTHPVSPQDTLSEKYIAFDELNNIEDIEFLDLSRNHVLLVENETLNPNNESLLTTYNFTIVVRDEFDLDSVPNSQFILHQMEPIFLPELDVEGNHFEVLISSQLIFEQLNQHLGEGQFVDESFQLTPDEVFQIGDLEDKNPNSEIVSYSLITSMGKTFNFLFHWSIEPDEFDEKTNATNFQEQEILSKLLLKSFFNQLQSSHDNLFFGPNNAKNSLSNARNIQNNTLEFQVTKVSKFLGK